MDPWSKDDKSEAARLRKSGWTYSQIGDELGKTPASVRGVLRRMGESTMPDTSGEKIAKSKEEISTLKSRVRELEKLLESQQRALEESRGPRVALGGKALTKAGRGDFCRVIIPDSHGCYIDPAAAGAMLADLEELNPKQVVMMGDHLDCGGFLAQHQTLMFLPEATYTFENDVACCNDFLDAVQKRAPSADIHYLMGNHEVRISRWVIKQTLNNPQDSTYLYRLFGPSQVLNLEKRGIQWYEQDHYYHGLSIPGTIKLGHCHFTHGTRTGKNASADTLRDFGGNVVHAHTHRVDSYTVNTVSSGIIGAWNPGCLCLRQRLWQHTQVSQWSHGYGIQLVRENGEFLHINVPIIDGKSYLVPLLESRS